MTHLPLLVGKRECSHYFIFPPKPVSYNEQRPRSKSLPVRNVPEVDEWLISRGCQHNRELLTRVPGQLGQQCTSMRPADRTWSISRGSLQRRDDAAAICGGRRETHTWSTRTVSKISPRNKNSKRPLGWWHMFHCYAGIIVPLNFKVVL